MGRIRNIQRTTGNPYVNLYELDVENSKGHAGKYYLSSRAKCVEDLELSAKKQSPDGVIIYSLYGEKRDRVVLIRQYRYTIDNYIYEFPAGLIEAGEEYHSAAVREMREETGLTLHPIPVDTIYEKPYYTTIGMTDECCATVYGYADGEIRADMQEISEEIEVVLADRDEVRRILREERVAIVAAYMLLHFLADEEPFAFLQERHCE
ncbi:MAG: NUDIX hydrolase [Clostridiales bacterium]|nr:NUDIX hydrolase [Clostridiales bacterium]